MRARGLRIGAARFHRLAIAVLVLGVGLTLASAIVTRAVHGQTEQRLLEERTDEVGAVLTTAISGVQSPLAAAAELAAATGGATADFEAVMTRAIADELFVSAALYEAGSDVPLVTVGEPTVLGATETSRVQRMVDQAVATDGLAVIDTLDLPQRRLGYGFSSPGDGQRYVVYAESALPAERTTVPPASGPFESLDYALYLGAVERAEDLLYTSVADLPIDGRRAETTVSFGDGALTLVASTDETLGGSMSAALPWIVVVGGLGLTVAASAIAERLARRERDATQLADSIAGLYDEQRVRTLTLQRSLMPRTLPAPPGMEVIGCYWPGDLGADVGGDFYDVFPLGGHRWGVAIGDVCGRGIDAAALTGLTRHTIRAAARHLASPADVLRWAHEAIAADGAHTYCTACFAFLHVPDEGPATLELALGGHPQPLLARADGTVVPIGHHGTVLGLVEPELTTTTHTLEAGDDVIMYTDGITDAPGNQALGDDELAALIGANGGRPLLAIADAIRATIDARRPSGDRDDTALLMLRKPAARVHAPQTGVLDGPPATAGAGAR